MARRGIDSDTSIDLDDNPSNKGKLYLMYNHFQLNNVFFYYVFLEFSDNLSSLGIPGTRQTLYLSGEENVS